MKVSSVNFSDFTRKQNPVIKSEATKKKSCGIDEHFSSNKVCLLEQMSNVLDIAIKNANTDIENLPKNFNTLKELSDMQKARNFLVSGKNAMDEILAEKYKNNSLINFASSTNEHKARMKSNKIIIHGCALTAATTAAALAQTPGGDEAALTALTLGMTAKLCSNYKDASISIFAPLAAQILGKLLGETAAKYAIKWIPGVGNAANAAITFSLHETTGWALVAALEKFEKEGSVAKGDIDNFISTSSKFKK